MFLKNWFHRQQKQDTDTFTSFPTFVPTEIQHHNETISCPDGGDIEINPLSVTCLMCKAKYSQIALEPCHHSFCNLCFWDEFKGRIVEATCPICSQTIEKFKRHTCLTSSSPCSSVKTVLDQSASDDCDSEHDTNSHAPTMVLVPIMIPSGKEDSDVFPVPLDIQRNHYRSKTLSRALSSSDQFPFRTIPREHRRSISKQ